MDIPAIVDTSGYTSLGTSQSIQATGRGVSVSSGTGKTSSGNTSQATSTDSSSSTSGTSAIYNPEDLNMDGVVTYAEKMQYAMTHPLEMGQSSSSATHSYSQEGQVSTSSDTSPSSISVYA